MTKRFFTVLIAVLFIAVFSLPVVAQTSDAIDVVATGIGKDAEAALRNAFSNAVSQVVGTLVRAEVLVANDRLLRDEVLTHSNGFVKTYNVIDRAKLSADGLWEIRIEATINQTTLMDTMRNVRIIEKEIDQGSIRDAAKEIVARQAGLAADETIRASNQSAEEMLEKVLEGFYERMIDIMDVRHRTRLDSQKSTIEVDIDFAVNQRKYNDFKMELSGNLKEIFGNPEAVHSRVGLGVNAVGVPFRAEGLGGIGICDFFPYEGTKNAEVRWTIYRFNSPLVARSLEQIPKLGKVILHIRVVNEAGEPLGAKRITSPLPYGTDSFTVGNKPGYLLICPTVINSFRNAISYAHMQAHRKSEPWTTRVSIPVPELELQNVHSVQLVWEKN